MKGWRVPRRSSSRGVKDRNSDRDEDLVLFRELQQRNKDRNIVSLLLPVSDEFEPDAPDHRKPRNYEFYRIPSAKKGSSGFEFLTENDKRDTDWLKTPPATPLFPSLEMELPTGPQLVNVNKKHTPNPIPLQQPPQSRFAAANHQQPKRSPLRSITPSQSRPTAIASSTAQTKKPTRSTPPEYRTVNNSPNSTNKSIPTKTEKEIRHSELIPQAKPRSRGVSPLVRSTIQAQILIPELSNETPPNLITDDQLRPRSISATRGRKVQEGGTIPKQRIQVLGSKMVDKVMNARKLNSATNESTKPRGNLTSESYRTGRMISTSTKANPPTLWSHLQR